MVLIAVGIAGNRVSPEPLMFEQKDQGTDNDDAENVQWYQILGLIGVALE